MPEAAPLEEARLPERMDDPRLPRADTDRALADLDRVHRWVGHRALLSGFARVMRAGLGEGRVLFVGSGSGAVARAVGRWLEGRGHTPRVIELDRKLLHLTYRRAERRSRLVVADARRLPFRDGAIAFASSTLLQHHFDRREGARVLGEMRRVASRAVVVSDLRASRLGAWLGTLVLRLLRLGPVASYDGRLSLRQAWSEAEVRTAAGDEAVTSLERRFPFRWTAVLAPLSGRD